MLEAPFLLCACFSWLVATGCTSETTEKPTDYDVELERIQRDIRGLEDEAATSPLQISKATAFVYLLYRRAALTGSAADFSVAEEAIHRALERIGPSEDIYFLKARLDLRLHRIPDARGDLEMLTRVADRPQVMAVQADVHLQEGRYEEARKGYEGALAKSRSWDNLARLAHLKSRFGDVSGAEKLCVEAQDRMTAKEMRFYAWVEVQRGLLDFRAGRFEDALAHYSRADRAYSGYWLIEEHIAELRGAQGKFNEAVALYENVIARAPRPEFQQALGDLYAFRSQPDKAKPWHDKALAAYLDSARRGEVHYLHHLAAFYAEVRRDGAEAVRWARKDLELRKTVEAHQALAWALYCDGQLAGALDAMREALAPGVKDAHLFLNAARIHAAAGNVDEGKVFLTRARAINPHLECFHVHR